MPRYDFHIGEQASMAIPHEGAQPKVTLALCFMAPLSTSIRMTTAEARAMAVALEAAATHAENVIAETGLGESAVAS